MKLLISKPELEVAIKYNHFSIFCPYCERNFAVAYETPFTLILQLNKSNLESMEWFLAS